MDFVFTCSGQINNNSRNLCKKSSFSRNKYEGVYSFQSVFKSTRVDRRAVQKSFSRISVESEIPNFLSRSRQHFCTFTNKNISWKIVKYFFLSFLCIYRALTLHKERERKKAFQEVYLFRFDFKAALSGSREKLVHSGVKKLLEIRSSK